MQTTTDQTVFLLGEEVTLKFGRYNNKTIAIRAYTLEGEDFATVTVNYEENFEGENYKKRFSFPAIVIKNYSENEGIVQDLQNAGVIDFGGAYLSGSRGTVEVRGLSEKWQAIAKKQLKIKN